MTAFTFEIECNGLSEPGHYKTEAAAWADAYRYDLAQDAVSVWQVDMNTFNRRLCGYAERPRHEDSKIANHIDGYDRDDLGESPDY